MNNLLSEDLKLHYEKILISAAVSRAPRCMTDADDMALVERAFSLVERLARKHLSDSPDIEDRRRLLVELLEKALAIAKGEAKL